MYIRNIECRCFLPGTIKVVTSIIFSPFTLLLMSPEIENFLDPLLQALLDGDGIHPIDSDFATWIEKYSVTPQTDFTGIKPLQEVFIPKSALDRIMTQPTGTPEFPRKFGGIAIYHAIKEIPDPNDPTKKVKAATIGVVAVDDQGRAYNDLNQGAFDIYVPCPPYCPKWR
jgi:hypothetical protein